VVCGGASEAPVRGPARRLFGLGLDANATDAAALETLPGIGPARARALVQARLERRFCRARDLERAEGIGPRIRAAIAAELRFPADCRQPSGSGLSGPESW
jgi:ribosomal protein S13